MKKTLLCVLFCLMGCFVLSACSAPKIPDPYGIMEPTQPLSDALKLIKPKADAAQQSAPAQTKYSIVVDDGFGMKGFVSPFCMSYRATISAVTSVSINSARTCYRASEFPSLSTEYEADQFFKSAVQDNFFAAKSNDIASVITKMAQSYQKNPDQVMILISDLMIPTEDDCMQAASALQTAVIEPEHTTLGLIGIVADFRGSIENLPVSPITGQIRKISDYMIKQRETDGNIRHPLYMLFFGNDQNVLSAMQKSLSTLESCKLLDKTMPYYALYFTEYDVSRLSVDDIFCTFQLGCQKYNLADYSAEYLIRGVENKDGEVRYPSLMGAAITKEEQQKLSELKIAKIYDLERGNTKKNILVQCSVPFTFADSAQSGVSLSDPYQLVTPAEKLVFTKDDYEVKTEIRVLEYTQREGAKPEARWVVPDRSMIDCVSAVIDEGKRKIDVVLSVNTSLLALDEPLLCTVSAGVNVKPEWQEVAALYQTDWVDDLTLNLREFDQESINYGKAESSARYTYATTAKTPFLSSLICVGMKDQQTERVIRAISEKTTACMQTTMFGIVVRDMPGRYLKNETWEETDDFYGWAFSVKDAREIQAAIN